MQFKRRLDAAVHSRIEFDVQGAPYECEIDLRYRSSHASGGLIREPGTVGNLPSGEAYIVPYEGERPNDPSATSGFLPVQLGDEIVVYELRNNKAVRVVTEGNRSVEERTMLDAEPAYGNIAELGLGVLGDWGIEAVGSILIDEKLGLHIAFGRSDHFGGVTGTASFVDPKRVVHVDRVYVPSCQPLISVKAVELDYGNGRTELILQNNHYLI
jgi:leucyl aminopeptidase (aminopeptidase T)